MLSGTTLLDRRLTVAGGKMLLGSHYNSKKLRLSYIIANSTLLSEI